MATSLLPLNRHCCHWPIIVAMEPSMWPWNHQCCHGPIIVAMKLSLLPWTHQSCHWLVNVTMDLSLIYYCCHGWNIVAIVLSLYRCSITLKLWRAWLLLLQVIETQTIFIVWCITWAVPILEIKLWTGLSRAIGTMQVMQYYTPELYDGHTQLMLAYRLAGYWKNSLF